MKLLICAVLLAVCASAQSLSVTLTKTDGTTVTRTLTGPPVTYGIEVLDLFRAATCTTRSADGGCAVLKYPDTSSAILGVLIDKIVELSDTYPTSATAGARAKKAQAEAEIAATKTALANAAKPQ